MNKTEIIQEYVRANPGHTWKNAKEALEPYDITRGYFSMQKSKLKKATSKRGPKKKKATGVSGAKRGPKPKNVQENGSQSSFNDLLGFANVVRSVGGITSAQNLLDQLKDYQV